MRIAMLSYHTCPLATLGGKDTGGMNVYVKEVTRKLGRLGVHVDVFTRSQDEHVPHVLHDLGFGNRVVHIPSGPEIPLPKKELSIHIDEFVSGIMKFSDSKNLKYDLIHSHYWMSGIAAINLMEQWEIPFIQMFHTLGLMKNRVAQDAEEIEGDYRYKGEKQVLNNADRIIAATPAELAQLQWLYKAEINRIVVIPPGVDTHHFYPISKDEAKEYIGAPPCDKMLLFVGRMEPLKGLDVLLEAISIMRLRGVFNENPFCLAVIGGEPDVSSNEMSFEMARIQSMREQFGLEELVTFLGKRGQDSLPYYYSAAEAVIVPSHYESFGMVALEAMACGTPVVASEVGGLSFLIQDNVTGFTVPVDEPDALADRITLIMSDPELRQRLSNQALIAAQAYDWEKITTRLISLYSDVIEQHKMRKSA